MSAKHTNEGAVVLSFSPNFNFVNNSWKNAEKASSTSNVPFNFYAALSNVRVFTVDRNLYLQDV